MLVSLIHPSRSRPEKSFDNAMEWVKKAGVPVELVVSVDSDDPKQSEYYSRYAQTLYGVYSQFENQGGCAPIYLVNPNTCVVEAANHAAKSATGDILIYLSDDFKCPENWGV